MHLTSAPVPGKVMKVSIFHPTTAAGRPYVLFWSGHTEAVLDLKLPFVKGLLRLDLIPALANPPLAIGLLGNTGISTAPLPLPPLPVFVGLTIDSVGEPADSDSASSLAVAIRIASLSASRSSERSATSLRSRSFSRCSRSIF